MSDSWKESVSDLTAQCIRCGFCLESCPTFLVTGNEAMSPRGRIYQVRLASQEQLGWKADAAHSLDTCLGCRACETACPSGVEYGLILELARERLHEERARPAEGALLASLSSPRTAAVQSALSSLLPDNRLPDPISLALTGEKAEASMPEPQILAPWPPLSGPELPPVKGRVALLTGCVMSVLFPRVHQATRRLLRRLGYETLDLNGACCGALHAHGGRTDDARKKAAGLAASVPRGVPLIINSAGCGSTIKEFPRLIGPGLEELKRNSWDVSEFLYREGLVDLLVKSKGVPVSAVYHHACHLSHGQGVRLEPLKLLAAVPGLVLRHLEESEVCCGSAGTYNVTQPRLARKLLDRKMANIDQSGAEIVVMGNPGCHGWIAQGARESGKNVRVLHTAELLESSFSGLFED